MSDKDLYSLLECDRGASPDDLKRAYRKLAHRHHPDKTDGGDGAADRFKAINEAYEILKDPEKRERYDRFGYAGVKGVGAGAGNVNYGVDFQDFFSDVFGDFFGRSRRPRAERGSDLRYDLEIEFKEAALGMEKTIKIPRSVTCAACEGSGAKPGTSPETCTTCAGTGQVSFQQGFFSVSRTCSSCRGSGSIIKDPCRDCGGTGSKRETTELSIKVPPGVDTGSRLRLTGEGEHGERGGPPGDLYVVMHVSDHPIFKRSGGDIVCEVPISFPQAALGTTIEVPSLAGTVKVKVPAGTQTGKIFRLKGKGIVSIQTGLLGDELVVVRIETPAKLTKKQKELLGEFADLGADESMPEKKNFLGKVKDLFE